MDGIFNLMKKMGIWLSECAFQRYFSSTGEALERTEKRDLIGKIVDPLKGTVLDEVTAPVDGKVFFIHNEPLTYANTAVIKLVQ